MTLGHILATTKIRYFWRRRDKYDERRDLQKHGVDIIKAMQREFRVKKDTTTIFPLFFKFEFWGNYPNFYCNIIKAMQRDFMM